MRKKLIKSIVTQDFAGLYKDDILFFDDKDRFERLKERGLVKLYKVEKTDKTEPKK